MFLFQVWFSNRRARLRKQLSSSSSSYTPLGVVGGHYNPPNTPYATPMGQSLNDGGFGAAASVATSSSQSKLKSWYFETKKFISSTMFRNLYNHCYFFDHVCNLYNDVS